MIFVSVGTHYHDFSRLIHGAQLVSEQLSEPIVVQYGHSEGLEGHAGYQRWFSPAEMDQVMRAARVVVCHAGPATLFRAVEWGHRPIVMPREPGRGEHVDPHQVQFCRHISDWAEVVHTQEALQAALQPGHHRGEEGSVFNASWVSSFKQVADDVVKESVATRQKYGKVPFPFNLWFKPQC